MAGELQARFLMWLRIELAGSNLIGATPAGDRRIDHFKGGSFEGPRLRGIVRPGGSDALSMNRAGVVRTDVRLTLEAHDGQLIYVTYRGLRHARGEVMARIARGEDVAPSTYYLRSVAFFETGSADYDWLNRIIAVGVGARLPNAALYRLFEIL